jgi:hypothetical protein
MKYKDVSFGQAEAVFNKLGGLRGVERFLNGELKLVENETNKLLNILAKTNISTTVAKKTEQCFAGLHWRYRDNKFDQWLADDRLATEPALISTLSVSRDRELLEVTQALPGIVPTTNIVRLGNQLIALGYTMTPQQAEEMVEATKCGKKTGMQVNKGNFFFIETGYRKNPVVAGYINDDTLGWCALCYKLEDSKSIRAVDHRLLVRNLDASQL